MQITRRFVPEGTDPYSMFKYVKHQCLIKHHVTGQVKIDYTAEVPEHWSVNARNIAISKYFRLGGVPETVVKVEDTFIPTWLERSVPSTGATFGGEQSIRQVLHRIVGHWTYTGLKNGYFDGTDAKAFYDENVYILLAQMAAPNSPQWFNTGLYWSYGITGPKQGHWYVDLEHDTRQIHNLHKSIDGPVDKWNKDIEDYTRQSENAYEKVQAHACFILTLDDTMFNGETGIFEWYNAEGLIFKYGSGSGTNASNLRGEGEKLSGGGKSSGVMSWLKVCDYSAGAIKSGGTTRRAAKMVCLNVDHPDIEEFINCKVKSEIAAASLIVGSNAIEALCQQIIDKVRGHGALYHEDSPPADVLQAMKDAHLSGIPHNYIKKAERMALLGYTKWVVAGYDNEYEGEAYSTVPFQNANHSVRLTQDFYNKCTDNLNWTTTYRTTGEVKSSQPARDLEWKIASAAWFCGDPGVQYHTNINDWNVTPLDGGINASNPCSEHMRLDDSGCNLASLRLMAFLNNGVFDVEAYAHVIRLYQMNLDITVTMSHLPTKRVAMNVFNYRDTGLGYCDLGALIMALGLSYDSHSGRALAAALTAVLQGVCHKTSACMAQELGSYPRFRANHTHHIKCVHNHMVAAGISGHTEFEGLTNKPLKINWWALNEFDPQLSSNLAAMARTSFLQSVAIAKVHGYRNAEMTVLAPTGTISLIMDCDTTGVEPMLGLTVHKTLAGGGSMKLEPARSVAMALKALGYTTDTNPETVEKLFENYPDFLNEADRPVFETSFPHPKTKASIPWQAHIEMMAAVQPFLSGSISKTINMPSSASIEDIRQAYRMGNDLGLKSVAIYRDLCKLSQPLNIPSLVAATEEVEESAQAPAAIESLSPAVPAGGRMLLGWQRNPGIDIKVGVGGGSLYLRTTRYPDGKCAEIWATYSADQGIIMALLGSVMKTGNIALQWGVPLEDVIRSWHDTLFSPSGIVGEHPYIRHATSILNLIARLLDYHELGNTSSLNIQPGAHLSQKDTKAVTEVINKELGNFDKLKVTGETCPNCGSQAYIISGANCKKCVNCGSAGGCG